MYIHELSDWPEFRWDNARLSPQISDLRYQQGRLLGRMQTLGFELKREANLGTLTNDVVKSSAIEGKVLNPEEVRSSIAQRLGLEAGGLVPISRDVESVVEMMIDATNRYKEPLTKDRLTGWHAALFPTGQSGLQKITIGAWRPESKGAMQVISGPIGREKVHFEAPHASLLENEMSEFLDWFESEQKIDPVLKAGIAHLWFVTIHPFEDGNGRIARAITDMVLARADHAPDRFYSMSTQIESERKMYYEKLERQQKGNLDITNWLEWFFACLGRAISSAEDALSDVIYKADLWAIVNERTVNERQRLVLNRMLDNFKGFMSTSKYAKLTKCSQDTALRDIHELLHRGILIQNPAGGRSTSYRLANISELKKD